MLNSLQIKFLILIALVFIVNMGFAIVIWQQTINIEKKALAAKQRQKTYMNEEKPDSNNSKHD